MPFTVQEPAWCAAKCRSQDVYEKRERHFAAPFFMLPGQVLLSVTQSHALCPLSCCKPAALYEFLEAVLPERNFYLEQGLYFFLAEDRIGGTLCR